MSGSLVTRRVVAAAALCAGAAFQLVAAGGSALAAGPLTLSETVADLTHPGAAAATAGDQLQFTIAYANSGTTALGAQSIEDDLSGSGTSHGERLVPVSWSTGGTESSSIVAGGSPDYGLSWTVGSVGASAGGSVSFVAQVSNVAGAAEQTVCNLAVMGTGQPLGPSTPGAAVSNTACTGIAAAATGTPVTGNTAGSAAGPTPTPAASGSTAPAVVTTPATGAGGAPLLGWALGGAGAVVLAAASLPRRRRGRGLDPLA